MAVAGFGPIDLSQVILDGKPLGSTYGPAIIDMYIQRTIMGCSTITIQMNDPDRSILRNLVKQGAELTIDGLSYNLVQFSKASDQLQLVFESSLVYRLSLQQGQTKAVPGYNITEFIKGFVEQAGGTLVGPDYETIWPLITKTPIYKLLLVRGTSADSEESSWACMNRLASSIGWRIWESADVVYFGPDEYWLGTAGGNGYPPINYAMGTYDPIPVIQEFTQEIQLIDFDWNVGQPFGQASVTALLDNFQYNIGEVIKVGDTVGSVNTMGVATGYWLVYAIQRDLFNPQVSMTLQVPMPIGEYIAPTSAPVPGLPLQPLTKAMIK
jgi:hypothetical protein